MCTANTKILDRIINILMLNASFIKNLGLLNGRMGVAIFFYHLARKTNKKNCELYAGELLDEIFEEINQNTPIDFENGLMGIGWGIEYLVQNGFVDADTDDVLAEIDNVVFRRMRENPSTDMGQNVLYGNGLFCLKRFGMMDCKKKNLKTPKKGQYLDILLNDFDRLISKRQEVDSMNQQLTLRQINSLVYFLIGILKNNLCHSKQEFLFQKLIEYLQNHRAKQYSSPADYLIYRKLMYILIEAISSNKQNKTYNFLLELFQVNDNNNCDLVLDEFIAFYWQGLLYGINAYDERFDILKRKAFSYVQHDDFFDNMSNNRDMVNFGLCKGLAGLGLAILEAN